MKKTMFITSVIMVVVMAIALTTSSLAWFTATGSSTVTTAALTLTAQVDQSGGIQFMQDPHTSNTWLSSLTLDGTVSGLNPLVIRTNKTNTGDQVLAAQDVEDALNVDTAAALASKFIGNYINSNGNFTGSGNNEAGASTVYYDGFFEDTFWVTNLSSSNKIKIKAAIDFYESAAANAAAYTSTSTGYGTDATLWVAVLMKKQQVDTTTGATFMTDPTDSENTWEVVSIASSKGDDLMKVGLADAGFAAGQTYQSATFNTGLNIAGLRDGNTGSDVTLDEFSQDTQVGGVGHVKVIAWYDGTTLHSNNAGTDIVFKVTFDAVTQTPAQG